MPRTSHGPRPIRGNNRDNTLHDTAGNDVMDGRGGDDVLISTRGNDTMTGGAGADTFVFNPSGGTVTITDFEDGVDLLDISAFGFDSQGGSALYWGNLETWATIPTLFSMTFPARHCGWCWKISTTRKSRSTTKSFNGSPGDPDHPGAARPHPRWVGRNGPFSPKGPFPKGMDCVWLVYGKRHDVGARRNDGSGPP